MNWQRPARIGVALIGVGFAVMLFLVFGGEQPVPSRPPLDLPTDPEASSESGRGNNIRLRGSERELTIEFERSQTYPDGRVRFEQAHVVFASGQELWADVIEATGRAINADEPSRYELTGHVRLVEGERLSVETDRATYDDVSGVLTMPGAVTFVRGPVTGGGTGATYDRALDVFRLMADARARVEAGPDGAGGVDATAESMSLAREQNYLRLERNARLVREFETLSADVLTVNFLEAGNTIRFLELRGHARVDPKQQSASATPSMKADDITLAFYPDNATLQHATLTGEAVLGLPAAGGRRTVAASWIDIYLAGDGATVTRLDGRSRVLVTLASDPPAPARTIRAGSLISEGTEDGGLQSARFDDGVEFIERRPATADRPADVLTATSRSMILALGGDLDDIDQADFRDTASFEVGDVRATADVGRYDAERETLALRRGAGAGAALPRVEDERLTIEGTEIDLALASDELVGRGGISTVTLSTATGEAPESGGPFGGDEPVYGSAESLEYAGGDGRAVYRGGATVPARLVQGRERLSAAEIIVEEASGNLRASGQVESLFSTRPDPGEAGGRTPGAPVDSTITADAFVYESAEDVATYTGFPVTMTNPDGQTVGERLVVRLSESTRAVEWFEATTAVYAELVGGHEVRGDVLTYDARSGTYTLLGTPAQAKSPDEEGQECVLSKGPRVVFTPGAGASWRGFSQTVPIRCEVSIR